MITVFSFQPQGGKAERRQGNEGVQLDEGPCEKIIMISFSVEVNTVEPTTHDGSVLLRDLEKYRLDSKPEGFRF